MAFNFQQNQFFTEAAELSNVKIQLAVTLYRLGAPSTIWNISILFGIAEGEEYLLADLAYPLLPFIIIPFKVLDGPQQQQQINYNIKHSKTKVVVEQAFGRLKARFLFLKEMRIRDPPKGIEIIDTILILHNFIEKHEDAWEQSDYDNSQIEIQPKEDCELIDQTLESNNIIQKEYTKIKRQNLLEL
ncbi:putative nuclease harbi1 [Gigaspora margarita]|uniref:Putative nuclease harbi1 n=1 Tax=Gigaspora margarita TaxID=4874 RepID=A0A8H4A6U9_GIGMA|nr:putative nuclease harbi1 [Gigaspora margarita]